MQCQARAETLLRSKDEDIPGDIDTGIIQEWHYAINWITYYDENWDDILTDT